jgi:transposase
MRVIRWDEEAAEAPAQARLQWMWFYFFNGRNALRTCRHFGISRQTFYRWKRRFDRHDLTTLEARSHRPRQVRKPTWTVELAERIFSLRKQYPRWGKDKLAVLLRREKRTVSTSMVGRILVDLKRRGALHEPPKSAVLRQARRKLRNRPWAIRKPKHLAYCAARGSGGDRHEGDSRDFVGRRAFPGHAARALAVSRQSAAGGWWQ